ncbi:glycoside hydrolase family 18 protein [Lapidilactobacillus gannanensis]|uniref:chitinase n=1 Tax=Lapidilactobacillus gannanensis TaxID=2486002 RepID=A0ABW4BK76_9LACO|nr:glycoside hydrolase family 18 protein [Lapidilactobacillus gannanensis]
MRPELIAYLDDNRPWQQEDIAADKLTCINYAFGKIAGLKIIPKLKKIQLINNLKRTYPHLKTCISIGGWSVDGFSDAVSTDHHRQIFVDNLVAYMREYDFDGIDLDWEYPGMDLAGIKASSADAQNFLLLVQLLRAKLTLFGQQDHRYYRLTAAVGAAQNLLVTMSPTTDYQYVDYLDYLNVMTYDMRGSWTKQAGHHTNLYSYATSTGQLSVADTVDRLVRNGVSPTKIVIGAGFYSRDWFGFDPQVSNPVGATASTYGTQATNYVDLQPLLASEPENFFWDDQAQAPYYFNGSQFSSFDNPRSMSAKAKYVLENNLRGLMFWEYSLDPSQTLLTAAAQEFVEKDNT